MSRVFLSVIIPTYNEEKRIDNCLKKVKEYFSKQKYNYEIIFVDDGSSDSTMSKLKCQMSKAGNWRLIENKINHGKGYVVRQGIMEAKGEYILFTDTDLSTPIEEIAKLLPFIKKYPIVIGSRYIEKGTIKVKQPLLRRVLSRFGHLLIEVVLALPFADTQCGFKLFQAKVAKDIFSRSKIDRWGFDMEVLAIAQKLNYKIKEVAVSWYNDPHSQLRAGKAAWNTLKELFRIKMNFIKGRYNIRTKSGATFFQMIKFGIVGVSGTLIDLGIYNLLAVVLDFNIYISRAISFTLAASNNYILNRIWTFHSKEKRVGYQYAQFFIVSTIGLIINLGIMRVLESSVAGLQSEILKKNIPVLIAIVVVFFWNFFANKYWTFRRDTEQR